MAVLYSYCRFGDRHSCSRSPMSEESSEAQVRHIHDRSPVTNLKGPSYKTVVPVAPSLTALPSAHCHLSFHKCSFVTTQFACTQCSMVDVGGVVCPINCGGCLAFNGNVIRYHLSCADCRCEVLSSSALEPVRRCDESTRLYKNTRHSLGPGCNPQGSRVSYALQARVDFIS